MFHHNPRTCTLAHCGQCIADFDRRRKAKAVRLQAEHADCPPTYDNRKKTPSYAASEAKAERDELYKEQHKIMQDDMKKNCHQIVGETDSEFDMRKARWQQAIDRRLLELDYDAEVKSSKSKPAESKSK